MGAKGSDESGKKTADENDSDEKRAGERGADEESPTGEPDPEEGAHPEPGQISALLEQLARPPEGEPAEWAGLAVGSSVDHFDVLREIGRGGFGMVYEAYDRNLRRPVALKAIRSGPRPLAEARSQALRDEAEAVAQLSHPNIVTIHEFRTSERGSYLVMEMLQGETLQERLARGALPVPEAVARAVGVARALAHAHGHGVRHRDLKPANVFLTEGGEVKVLDFGLAHFFGTSGMRGGGTPGHMAPEQWRGEPEDARTDVFGLGVLLFEMLTGRLPFRVSRDRSEALDPGPAPALPLPDAPPALAALVARALAKDPAERPGDGRAMLEALVEIQRSLPGGGMGPVPATGRAARRFWNAVVIVAAVALVAVAVVLIVTPPWVEPPRIPVVVADLSNETGDPQFDNLSGLLIVSLQQSEILVPLTRQQMLDIAGRGGAGGATRIDEELGRRIARQARAKALLLATLHRFDDAYALEMRAIDPSSGENLFGLKEEGVGKSSVLGLIDRVSDRARRAMSERAAAVRRSTIKVEDAITHSLEAYQHYFRSQECMYRTSFGQSCAGELREALAIDPTFALAYYQLAVWEERHGGARSAEVAATEAAVRYLDRAPPKEQALIRAWKAHSDGNDDESLAVLKQLIERRPRDPEAIWEAGDLLYHRSDFAGAIPFFERLLALEPAHGWGLDHLAHALGALRRTEDLRKRVAEWAAAPPGPTVFHALSAAQVWLGDYPAAIATAQREAEAGGGLSASEDLLFAGIAAGDYRRVEEQVGALAVPGSPAPAIGYYALAALDGYQGHRRRGLGRFDAMVRDLGEEAADSIYHSVRAHYLAGGSRPGPVWDEVRELRAIDPVAAAAHAVSLAWLGDLDHAAEVAVNLRPGTPRRETYDAVVLWQRGQRSEALRRLQEIAARSPFDADFALAPAYLLGDLAAQSGADAEAVKALHDFRSLFLPIMMWRSWAYPRSLVLSAASLGRLGRRAEALELVNRLLADWRDADPGLPLLEEARALKARLASARAQTRPPMP